VGVIRVDVRNCRLIEFRKIQDIRGNLSFIEGTRHVPFEIKRIFYLYDVPTGESRGAHAHKALQQLIICLSGSFDVALDDGATQRLVHLNRPWQGLYVPPLIWAAEVNFDPGSVCLVLASDFYCEADYYREYDAYRDAVRLARERAAMTVPDGG
jgi:oxalate decarboxylase/phosphoglucose isomerase-like protein (cupin superfamily)